MLCVVGKKSNYLVIVPKYSLFRTQCRDYLKVEMFVFLFYHFERLDGEKYTTYKIKGTYPIPLAHPNSGLWAKCSPHSKWE